MVYPIDKLKDINKKVATRTIFNFFLKNWFVRTMSPSNRHLESTAIGSPLPGRGRGGGKENMPRQGLAVRLEEHLNTFFFIVLS